MKFKKLKPFTYENNGQKFNTKQVRDFILSHEVVILDEFGNDETNEFLVKAVIRNHLHDNVVAFLAAELDNEILIDILRCGDLENWQMRNRI